MASPTPFRFKVTTKEHPCPHCGSHKGLPYKYCPDCRTIGCADLQVSVVTNAVSVDSITSDERDTGVLTTWSCPRNST